MSHTKDRTLNRPDYAHAAHDTVTAREAADLYAANGLDWPVSGLLTCTGYGTIGMRRASQRARLWTAPGVTRRPIAAVKIGDTITTWQGRGVVTRKGSIAGWYMVAGVELRWDAADVQRVETGE